MIAQFDIGRLQISCKFIACWQICWHLKPLYLLAFQLFLQVSTRTFKKLFNSVLENRKNYSKKVWTPCWHLCCQRADKLPAGTKALFSLSGIGMKGNRWLWKKWWIQRQKETHLQRKSGRQYMLSAITLTKMQRKPCRRRLTGCWLQKQADRKCSWEKWLDWV